MPTAEGTHAENDAADRGEKLEAAGYGKAFSAWILSVAKKTR